MPSSIWVCSRTLEGCDEDFRPTFPGALLSSYLYLRGMTNRTTGEMMCYSGLGLHFSGDQ